MPRNKSFSDYKDAVCDALKKSPTFVEGRIFTKVSGKKRSGSGDGEWRGVCPFPGHTGKDSTDFTFNVNKLVWDCKAHGGHGVKSRGVFTYLEEIEGIDKSISWCGLELGLGTYEDWKSNGQSSPVAHASGGDWSLDMSLVNDRNKALLDNCQRLEEILSLGISKEVIKDHKIGWLEKPELFLFPVIGACNTRCVSAVTYRPDRKPKTKISKGASAKHLFPYSSLKSDTVYIFEGMKDTLLGLSLGLPAITNIGGAGAWYEKWGGDNLFNGKHVIICMDIDEPGKEGAKKRVRVLVDQARAVKNIVLPLDEKKYPGGDFYNYIVDEGHSKDDFLELVSQSEVISPTDNLSEKSSIDTVAAHINEKEDILYDEKSQRFYMYLNDSGIWDHVPDIRIEEHIMDLFGAHEIPTSPRKVSDVRKLLLLKSLNPKGSEMNTDPNIIVLSDCVYSMRDHKMYPFSKDYLATANLPSVRYSPDATCDLWQACLETWSRDEEGDVDNDWILFVQEMIGYCLSTWIKNGETFFLIGDGKNGKSKMINVLEMLIGDDRRCNVRFSQMEKDTYIIKIKDKLLNSATEDGDVIVESASNFKAAATGDEITGRELYKGPMSFRPFCKFVFASNTPPKVLDRSDGFYRRINIVPFDYRIDNQEQIIGLENDLKKELDGIFIWAVEGLKRLKQNGFTQCQRIINAASRYRIESDPFSVFIDEECEIVEYASIDRKAIYLAYESWCKESGCRPISRIVFGRRVGKLGGVSTEGAGCYGRDTNGKMTRYFLGIKLISVGPVEEEDT